MKFMPERKLMCEIGRRMWQRGWVAAADGNLSIKVSEDRLLVTPSGVSKGFMTPDMMVLTDRGGMPLDEGSPWRPSSELQLHLECYAQRPEIRGVCHAHPPCGTAFACAHRPLDTPILSEMVLTMGEVPCVPYARTGTEQLAEAVSPFVKGHNGVLLANHGAVTWGKDLEKAYAFMETLEHTAAIHLRTALLGGGISLPPEEVAALKKGAR